MFNKLQNILEKIRRGKPLVLNLTNLVSMDLLANGLLAVGAAPIMSVYADEVEELVKISGGVLINIGTLDADFEKLSLEAAAAALKYKKPVVLDPVGVGATKKRTELANKILATNCVTVIKGNASEIVALKGDDGATLGVESTLESGAAQNAACYLSRTFKTIVVTTGEVDIITLADENKRLNLELPFGDPAMTKITGAGCFLGSLIAAFLAVEENSFQAAELATLFWGLTGEQAARKFKGPGKYRQSLLNFLYQPDYDYLENRIYGVN